MSARGLSARLEKELGPAFADLSPEAVARLEALEVLLQRWGKAVGLSGFRTDEALDRRYFAEALRALPWLPARGRAVDIGSGGGSPALPLAIARESVTWTLVEANERKAVFLDEAVRVLGLRGVVVVAERYERVSLETPVDVVTVRGVAVDEAVLEKIRADLAVGGRFLWFSSEARLSEARQQLSDAWSIPRGPIRLLAGGGCLLVAEASA